MRRLKITLIFLALIVFFFNCTKENEANNPVTSPTIDTEGFLAKTAICPDRANYEVVILDIDRWEILLNTYRIRRNVESYVGVMWYQSGSFSFKGRATAAYDPILDLITIHALDSGWDRGHITYSMKFDESVGENIPLTMEGIFWYHEYPRHINRITGWLQQGRLGEHDAGPYDGLAKSVFYDPPAENPKKQRFYLNGNRRFHLKFADQWFKIGGRRNGRDHLF